MNYKQINKDLLTAQLRAADNDRLRDVALQEYDDSSMLVGDEHRLAIVPKSLCFVSVKDGNNCFDKHTLSILFAEKGCYDPAVVANNYLNGKMKVTELRSETNTAYVQTAFLKWFDPDAVYKIKSGIDLIMVYEDGNLAGLLAPVRFKPE